jgi:hypothetical protein
MTTMSDLVDAVLGEVYGYTATIDTTSYLTTAVDADDLTLTIASAANFSRGIVQVGDELLIVAEADRTAGTLTVGTASGRGIRGTTAASHAAGDVVTMSPSVPRFQAINAVNETLRSSGGLFAVQSAQVVYDPAQYAYEVPDGVRDVLDVVWMPPTGGQWLPVRRWSHDRFQSKVAIGSAIPPGLTIQISYSRDPSVPKLSQDFTETGLPDSCLDVIRFGAAWRVSAFFEPVSLLSQSAEADALKRGAYPTSRLKVSQYYYQLYSQRLSDEVRALQARYPIRTHYGV